MAKVFGQKVKRIRVNWWKLLVDIEDNELFRRFYAFRYRHPNMSVNRIAYYVIKKSYSTTALQHFLDDYYSNFGRTNPKLHFPKLIDVYWVPKDRFGWR